MENKSRKKQWIVRNKHADFASIANKYGISQILARIIRNRDIVGEKETGEFLRCSVQSLHAPSLLPNIDKAAYTILDTIKAGMKIRIVGDYDVDGICSSFILWKVFRAIGADVDTVLPHRIIDGYGISEEMVNNAYKDGVKLIVTCDNGIAATKPLRLAMSLGIRVVVTDHHEIPREGTIFGIRYLLPPANAIVDPKLPDFKDCLTTGKQTYPFPDICGAAVALKLCMHIRKLTGPLPGIDPAGEKEFWKEMESFCAIATICDVMPLQDENRVMVKRGLAYAAATQNIGLRALLDACGLTGKKLSCYHIGFIVGPCINASGRLDTAQLALQMFQTTDQKKAVQAASELVELNTKRKQMTENGVTLALSMIETTALSKDRVLVLHLPDCHESLAGIIAGKIREYWYRPTIVFTGHGMLKGSGRSIETYHMYEQLNKHKDMLSKFGGHAMAAGMSIEEEKLDAFREAINRDCGLSDADLEEKVYADMVLSPGMFDIRTVEEFELLEPCGTKNPKPVFMAGHITLTRVRILGRNRNVMKFTAVDEKNNIIDLMRFGEEKELRDLLAGSGKEDELEQLYNGHGNVSVDIVYYPEINEWNGTRSLQHVIRDWRIR